MEIRKAKPKDKPYKLFDGGGLFLLVRPNGSKLWQQRYNFLGKEKSLSHGQYPEVGIAAARRKRDEAKRLLAEGTDPSLQKKLDRINAENAARNTFKLVAEEHIENCAERLAPASMRKIRWHLLDLAKALHDRPINEITSAEVFHVLKGIEKSGRRETARKCRTTMSAVFKLAIVTLRAESDPTAPLQGALKPPIVTGTAAITDEKQFGGLLRSLDEFSGWPAIAAAMKFQILTMVRPGEARGAKREEFDLENATWAVSAERMKMRREHKVPLSRQALAIVRENWPKFDGVELIFPSLVSNRKWLSKNAFNSALRRMGYPKEEVSAHGFRVTASTILNTRGFDGDVIEAALAHQDKNAIRRTYNRSIYWDQRVEMMQAWADLLDDMRADR